MAGEVNVDAMLRRITAKQWREWEAYYELEPFGQIRDDHRAAIIATTIANVNRGKDQKPYKLEDFILKYDSEPSKPKQTWQEQLAMLTVLSKAWNAAGVK